VGVALADAELALDGEAVVLEGLRVDLGDDLVGEVRLRSDDDGVAAGLATGLATGTARGLVEGVAAAAAGERQRRGQCDSGCQRESGLACGDHDCLSGGMVGQATADAVRGEPRRSTEPESDAGWAER